MGEERFEGISETLFLAGFPQIGIIRGFSLNAGRSSEAIRWAGEGSAAPRFGCW
jgi:hypothetical protein